MLRPGVWELGIPVSSGLGQTPGAAITLHDPRQTWPFLNLILCMRKKRGLHGLLRDPFLCTVLGSKASLVFGRSSESMTRSVFPVHSQAAAAQGLHRCPLCKPLDGRERVVSRSS